MKQKESAKSTDFRGFFFVIWMNHYDKFQDVEIWL